MKHKNRNDKQSQRQRFRMVQKAEQKILDLQLKQALASLERVDQGAEDRHPLNGNH